MPDYHYLIPSQQYGLEKNLEYTIICDSIEEAEDCFVDAKERLLDVNNWNKYSEIRSLQFKLSDSHGKEAHRHARKGDHIRIEVLPTGQGRVEGIDWVAIEAIEYDDYPDQGMETFGMRLHPSFNPLNKQMGDAAYSLSDNATSTFVIQRRGRRLMTTYHGRNEPLNSETDGQSCDQTWLGLSDVQWASLASGIAETGMVKRS
jgi:hypothetical protein